MNRDLPSLTALRAFECMARTGSLAAAASELCVTEGAISRQLRVLEEELGLRLFIKESRRLRLSPEGERLFQTCGTAFDSIRDTCSQLQHGNRAQPFRLFCPASFLARWLIPRLETLRADLPDLQLLFKASDAGTAALLSGEADGVLLFGHAPWPDGIRTRSLAVERIGPVVSRNHPAIPADTGALLGQPLLHTVSRPGAWSEWAGLQGLDPARIRLGQAFEHLYYMLEGAMAGLGIAIAPEILVREAIRDERLLAPWGFVESGAELVLCLPARSRDQRGDRLGDWLRRQLAA